MERDGMGQDVIASHGGTGYCRCEMGLLSGQGVVFWLE